MLEEQPPTQHDSATATPADEVGTASLLAERDAADRLELDQAGGSHLLDDLRPVMQQDIEVVLVQEVGQERSIRLEVRVAPRAVSDAAPYGVRRPLHQVEMARGRVVV